MERWPSGPVGERTAVAVDRSYCDADLRCATFDHRGIARREWKIALFTEDHSDASNLATKILGNTGAYLAASGKYLGHTWLLLSLESDVLRLMECQSWNQVVGGSNAI